MNRRKTWTALVMAASFSIALLFISGCSEDDNPVQPPPVELDALNIICSPLSPAPGEVAQLTIQSAGSAPDLADYEWSVDAGSLIVDNGQSVPWQVPNSPTTATVTVYASIEAIRDTLTQTVAIRNFEWVPTGRAFSVNPVFRGTQLYFVGSYRPPTDLDFRGFSVFQRGSTGPVLISRCVSDLCPEGGFDFVFYPEIDKVIGSMVVNYRQSLKQQLHNVWVFPFFSAIEQPEDISKASPPELSGRRDKHHKPQASQDLDIIVWQENVVGVRGDGTDDLNDVRFYRDSDGLDMRLTTSIDSFIQIDVDTNVVYVYWRNIHPLITPQQDYVLFFRDTTRYFEPVLVPLDAGGPDTSQARHLNTFSFADIKIDEETIFQWNPAINTLLGFIDRDGNLCYFDYMAESALKLDNVGVVKEFVWSPDGDYCAAITENGVSRVDLSGNPTEVFTKEKLSDNISGINWSPDPLESILAFRIVRKGATADESWSSVIILSLETEDWDWYYATPGVAWDSVKEPILNYTWMRVIFGEDSDEFYVPIPTSQSGLYVQIYRSYVE